MTDLEHNIIELYKTTKTKDILKILKINNRTLYDTLLKYNIKKRGNIEHIAFCDIENADKTEMINDFLCIGMKICDIIKKYKINRDTFLKILHENGLSPKSKRYKNWTSHVKLGKYRIIFSQEIYQKIAQEFKISTIGKIANKYKVSTHTIKRILVNEGIEHTPNKNIYTIDEGYFDVIDSPEKAYIIGFIYADGSLVGSNSINISLQERDLNILEKIRKELKTEKPIYFKNKRSSIINGRDVTNVQNQYTFSISNKHICNVLHNQYGLIPNKTLKNLPAPNISDEHMKFFILGYFDGDGCIHFKPKSATKCRNAWSIVGDEKMMQFFMEFIEKNIGIKSYIKAKQKLFVITVYKRDDIVKLMEYLYNGCSIFLDRKHQKYLDLKNFHLNNSK